LLGFYLTHFDQTVKVYIVKIKFTFQPRKAVQAMAYIVRHIGSMDKVKLMKLLYLADREQFIRCGYPITGDSQKAMPYGPVPSGSLDLLNAVRVIPQDTVFKYLHIDDNTVVARDDPGTGLLNPDEVAVLDKVIQQYGHVATWSLVNQTHALPEYAHAYVEGAARPIDYELIAQYSNNPQRFRLNRPVISVEAAPYMTCPMDPADEDL
jgi:uncharacterized phage-associated protein